MIDVTLIDFAEYLADEARKVIRPYFRNRFSIEHKFDSTPVTEVDKKVEETIRKLVKVNYPEHGVYGEEFGSERDSAELVWVIDPIDGTKSFMTGRPIFGTLIALAKNGKPVLGIIDQPITEERWLGVNGETRFNNQIVKTRDCRDLASAYFATTSPFMFDNHDLGRIQNITNQVKCTLYGGDCYSYGQLASGGLDLVIESGLKPYDFCALVPVIEGAGGRITDWYGNAVTMESSGSIIASSDEVLHRQVLSLLY